MWSWEGDGLMGPGGSWRKAMAVDRVKIYFTCMKFSIKDLKLLKERWWYIPHKLYFCLEFPHLLTELIHVPVVRHWKYLYNIHCIYREKKWWFQLPKGIIYFRNCRNIRSCLKGVYISREELGLCVFSCFVLTKCLRIFEYISYLVNINYIF